MLNGVGDVVCDTPVDKSVGGRLYGIGGGLRQSGEGEREKERRMGGRLNLYDGI